MAGGSTVRGTVGSTVESVDRGFDGGIEVRPVESITDAEPDQLVFDRSLHLGEDQLNCFAREVIIEIDEFVYGRRVEIGDGFGGDDDPFGRGRCIGDDRANVFVEDLSVGEEQGASNRTSTRPAMRCPSGWRSTS